MRIGELAEAAQVGVQTVRYYQRIGLLDRPARPLAGYRAYTRDHLARLRFIRHAKQLGFSLEEMAALLKLSRTDCEDARSLARQKLVIVRQKIVNLTKLADVLEGVVAQCGSRGKYQGCPIIEALTATD